MYRDLVGGPFWYALWPSPAGSHCSSAPQHLLQRTWLSLALGHPLHNQHPVQKVDLNQDCTPIQMQWDSNYRALQVTCQRLEAWLSCYVECHHGNASLNQVSTTTPNLIKALHNLFRRPQLQTCKALHYRRFTTPCNCKK